MALAGEVDGAEDADEAAASAGSGDAIDEAGWAAGVGVARDDEDEDGDGLSVEAGAVDEGPAVLVVVPFATPF